MKVLCIFYRYWQIKLFSYGFLHIPSVTKGVWDLGGVAARAHAYNGSRSVDRKAWACVMLHRNVFNKLSLLRVNLHSKGFFEQ